ncbi:MAG: tetratricopeptide repeat protein [Niabella sp.]|nr:tetratricopeptide repeat protein [Niabella sp.]
MRGSLLILLLLLVLKGYGQDSSYIRDLISEGVELNDQGRFDEAIKKYDEALAMAPGFLPAQFEKSYTLMASRKFKDAIGMSRQIIKNKSADINMIGDAYSTWGMALDQEGNPKKALKVYKQGSKKAPDYGILNYSEAVSYFRRKAPEKGMAELKVALLKSPHYAPSHYLMGRMLLYGNHKTEAVLSYMVYLLFDNKSPRAAEALTTIRALMNTDSATLLQTKELLPGDRFARQVTQVIETRLSVTGGTYPDFWQQFYLPFFRSLQEHNYCERFAHQLFLPSENVMNEAWLQDHQQQLGELLIWFASYPWPNTGSINAQVSHSRF